MTDEERAIRRARSDEEWRRMRLEMRREQDRFDKREQDRLDKREREREKMTEEELRKAARNAPSTFAGLEMRLELLEADGSAQRAAILKMEKALRLLARAWTFFIVCVSLALMLKVLP
jgi:vacuolar-type H+-ATPase subunit E/Vma4